MKEQIESRIVNLQSELEKYIEAKKKFQQQLTQLQNNIITLNYNIAAVNHSITEFTNLLKEDKKESNTE